MESKNWKIIKEEVENYEYNTPTIENNSEWNLV